MSYIDKKSKLENARDSIVRDVLTRAGKVKGCLALTHAYSDGKDLAATDRNILVYGPSEYPEGFYDQAFAGSGAARRAIYTPVELSASYPNWRLVVPDVAKAVKTFQFDGASEYLAREEFQLQFELAKNGCLVRLEFLRVVEKPKIRYDVYVMPGFAPVVFKADDVFTVVIMPFGSREIPGLLREYKESVIAEYEQARSAGESLE